MASRQPLSFSDLLRRHRLAAGLSQEQLAARAGLSRRGVSDIERGLKRPYKDTVERLADALDLSESERAVFAAAARAHQPMGARDPGGSYPRGTMLAPNGSLAREWAPLVDRTRELALIERHLSAQAVLAEPHDPPLLVLAGEPGIGKSRLLREAARRASAAGWTLLSGGCVRRRGQEPFEPFVGIIARAVAATPAERQRRDLGGCGWLARLLPELAGIAPTPVATWALHPEQERRLMFAAVRRYLANVAGPAGTLLVLDDLHWAGADALDLLVDLVRESVDAPTPPIRIIAAYRTTELRPVDPLVRLLGELRDAGLLAESHLGRLGEDDAAALLDALVARETPPGGETGAGRIEERRLGADVRREILERAEGVPYFLVSAARELLGDEEDGADDDGRLRLVPQSVAQSIRARVAALSERARDVLGAAAVVGRVVPSALLMGLVVRVGDPADEDAVLSALEALCAAKLLVEQGSDYQFAHDLIREVTLADLGVARGRVLHRRVAEALVKLPDGLRERHLAEITHHYLEAGDGSAALPFAILAGDHAASLHAHEEAERLYTLALALAGAHGERRNAAEAQLKLGQMLTTRGRLDDGRRLLEAAVAGCRALGDPSGLARAEMILAMNLGLSARVEEAIAHFLSVRDLIGPVAPPREVALVYLWLSNAYLLISEHQEELSAAEHARTYAHQAADPLIVAQTEMRYGAALIRLGRIEEGCAIVERYLPVAPQIGDATDYGSVLWNLIEAYAALGDFSTAKRYVAQAETVAANTEHGVGIAGGAYLRGCLALCEGAWDDARSRFVEAVNASQAARLPQFPYYLLFSGHLAYLRGDRDEAVRCLEQASALTDQQSRVWIAWPCQAGLGEQDLLDERPEAAARRLEPWIGPVGDDPHFEALPLLPVLAQAYLELGREDEAETTVRCAVERAKAMKHRLVLVDALRVRALLAIRRREWEPAVAALDEALTLARAMPYPYAEAKALAVYGKMHEAQGELGRARERYRAALAICARLGERPYAERIERALVALGDAPTGQQ